MEEQIKLLHENELGNSSPSIYYTNTPVNLDFSFKDVLQVYDDFDFNSETLDKDTEHVKYAQIASIFEKTETSYFSTRGNISFRKRLTTIPWLVPFNTGDASLEVRSQAPGFLPPQTTSQETTFVRQYLSKSICFDLFFICTTLSASERSRSRINSKAAQGVQIPHFFLEKLRSIRKSDCNDFMIRPQITNEISDEALTKLGYNSTLIDVKWLTSEEGIDYTFDLFDFLSDHPNNYIKMSLFEKPIPFYSGSTTSEGCISVTQLHKYNSPASVQTYAQLLPGNSYGKNINSVQVNDSFVYPRTANDMNSKQIPLNGYSVQLLSNLTTQRVALYVIRRLTGQLVNDRDKFVPKGKPHSVQDIEVKDTSAETQRNSGLSIKSDDFNGSMFNQLALEFVNSLSNFKFHRFIWLLNKILNNKRLMAQLSTISA